jgi:hypothetical protein
MHRNINDLESPMTRMFIVPSNTSEDMEFRNRNVAYTWPMLERENMLLESLVDGERPGIRKVGLKFIEVYDVFHSTGCEDGGRAIAYAICDSVELARMLSKDAAPATSLFRKVKRLSSVQRVAVARVLHQIIDDGQQRNPGAICLAFKQHGIPLRGGVMPLDSTEVEDVH